MRKKRNYCVIYSYSRTKRRVSFCSFILFVIKYERKQAQNLEKHFFFHPLSIPGLPYNHLILRILSTNFYSSPKIIARHTFPRPKITWLLLKKRGKKVVYSYKMTANSFFGGKIFCSPNEEPIKLLLLTFENQFGWNMKNVG